MQNILLHPTYFASISHYVAMVHAQQIIFESDDNYQKQSNRNRMYVYSANGVQLLNIPIKHKGTVNQKYKEVEIEDAFGWQKQHFKSLEACYRTSPFFEYYEDDFLPFFEKKHRFLYDLNLETHQLVCDALQVELPFISTTTYEKEPQDSLDFRSLANGKKDTHQYQPYTQVFDSKYGFLNNLSILDLLFNEGPQAINYLKNQKISL